MINKEKSILCQVIEENYQYCQDEIIMCTGSVKRLAELCQTAISLHSQNIKKSDITQLNKILLKTDTIYAKLCEIYKIIEEDYPHPMKEPD